MSTGADGSGGESSKPAGRMRGNLLAPASLLNTGSHPSQRSDDAQQHHQPHPPQLPSHQRSQQDAQDPAAISPTLIIPVGDDVRDQSRSRSARRSSQGGGAPPSEHAGEDDNPVSVLIKTELSSFAAAASIAAVQKIAKELASNIDFLQKTNIRIEKINNDLSMLKQDRTPAGFKPFKMHFASPHLLDKPGEVDFTQFGDAFRTKFENRTFEEIKERLFYEYNVTQLQLDGAVYARRRASLRAATTKSRFLSQCTAACKTHDDAWSALDLDLDWENSASPVAFTHPDDKMLTAKFTALYIKVVERAATKKAKQTDEMQKKKELRQKNLEATMNTDPTTMITQVIDERISLKLGKGKSSQKAGGGTGKDPSCNTRLLAATMTGQPVTTEQVAEWSKNGQSPVKSGGKKDGKGKQHPKGSTTAGKGKPSPSSVKKPKGKGKGKAKPIPNVGKGGGRGWNQHQYAEKGHAKKAKEAKKGGQKGGAGSSRGSKGGKYSSHAPWKGY